MGLPPALGQLQEVSLCKPVLQVRRPAPVKSSIIYCDLRTCKRRLFLYAIVLEALDNYQQGLYRREGLLQKIRGSKYMLNIFYGDLDHVIMNLPLY